MAPQNDLTEQELADLDDWVAARAPSGDETQCAIDALRAYEEYWPASQCDAV